MVLSPVLDEHFDVNGFLSSLPENTVIIVIGCSDDRTATENYEVLSEIRACATNAHCKQIIVPGSARGLMDPSPGQELEKEFLTKKIGLLTENAMAVVIVAISHELCVDYAHLELSREGLNNLFVKQVQNLPDASWEVVGEKLFGVIAFNTFLDESGEEAICTELIGGMSVAKQKTENEEICCPDDDSKLYE